MRGWTSKTLVQPTAVGAPRASPPNLVDVTEDSDDASARSISVGIPLGSPLRPAVPLPEVGGAASRLELLMVERFQRLEARLDACHRVEAKLDALSDELHVSPRAPVGHLSSLVSHRPTGGQQARRAALLERGKGVKERGFGHAVSENFAARRSGRQSLVVPDARPPTLVMEESALSLESSDGAWAEGSGSKGQRGPSRGGSAGPMQQAASIVPTTPMGSSMERTEDGQLRMRTPKAQPEPEKAKAGSKEGAQEGGNVNGNVRRGLMRSLSNSLAGSSPGRSSGRKSDLDEMEVENKKEMRQKLGRKFTSMRLEESDHHSLLARTVTHPSFDACITGVVCVNALLIGAAVQHSAVSDAKTRVFSTAEYICTAIFLLELSARMWVHGRRFFCDPRERWWNCFEIFLVSISVADTVVNVAVMMAGGEEGLPSSAGFLGKLLRIFRMARIMRILRTVRFLAQLRIMTNMIVSSMMSLFWILVILTALIYVFAIILTQGATDYLHQEARPSDFVEVQAAYGSLFESMYTLYKAMSGGVNWGEVATLMRGPSWVYEAIVCGYMFFCLFAVINIVTGVFVDGAIELAKRDRTVLMHKMIQDNETQQAHLLELVHAFNQDGDEHITAEEFRQGLQKAEVRDFLSAMQVEINDAEQFFSMLDEDGSGEVDLVEFVTGMQRLRGEAKSVDIHMMLHENRKVMRIVNGLVDFIGDHLEELEMKPVGSDDFQRKSSNRSGGNRRLQR